MGHFLAVLPSFIFGFFHPMGPGYLSRHGDSLRVVRSGDRIPVGGEIFRTRSDRPFGPPSLLYNGHRVFPGGTVVGAWR